MLSNPAPPLLFALCDSSPQGGRNWLLTELNGIPGDLIQECAQSAKKMMRLTLDSAEQCDEPEQLRQHVKSCFFYHVLPPTALGTRQAGLAMKLHAVTHSVRLESSDWSKTNDLFNAVIGVTADIGSEEDLNMMDMPLSAFDYWHELQDDNVYGPTTAPVVDTVSLSKSLYVPGTLHITDNLSKGLLASLQSWDALKPKVEKVCAFFHAPYTRSLFSHRLVPSGLQWKFKSGPPSFDRGRAWGVVDTLCKWLINRADVLSELKRLAPHPPL